MQGIERMMSAGVVVYRATDLYPEITGDPLVALAEEILVRKADLVVATSQPVLDHLRALGNPRKELLLENGVDLAHFSIPQPVPSEYEGITEPIAVYAGALDQRFDFDLIRYLCAQLPSLRVMLIGPASSETRKVLGGIPNAKLLGPRRFEVLPAFLQHARIGLLPLSAHPANAGRSPMKLYEYGASGLPLVATWTTALARSEKPFVELVKTPQDFVGAVEAILTDENRYEYMRRSALEAAQRMSWDGIAERLLSEVYVLLDSSNSGDEQGRH
jgi:teichuronic acid biosynthesis glycosyltransferase TuaH